ncbi:hypothetical protein [Streptomyces sp. enrichment culture]|uniref:hypothetical protein n=1 Tax=Streptomyces sp. enrichment culture TaxID=1795815 RepID=UPI003F55E1DB
MSTAASSPRPGSGGHCGTEPDGACCADRSAPAGWSPRAFPAQVASVAAFGVLLDALVVRSPLVPAPALDPGRVTRWPGRIAKELGTARD